MNQRLFSFLLFSSFINWFALPTQAGTIINGSECRKVGIVLKSHDSGIKEASPLCHSGTIKVGSKLKIKIICLNDRKVRWILAGEHNVDSICSAKEFQPKFCPPGRTCQRNVITEGIKLSYPLSITHQSNRPKWKWLPVKGATKYQVRVIPKGQATLINEFVQSTEFTLTNQLPALERGKIYEAELTAFGGNDQVISEGVFPIYILSQRENSTLENDLRSIQNLSLSNEEKILYTDALLMSYSLLDETITYLEKETEMEISPNILILLGDRYLQAQRIQDAEKAYKRAHVSTNQDSLSTIQDRLIKIQKLKNELQSQLPTRMKLDQ